MANIQDQPIDLVAAPSPEQPVNIDTGNYIPPLPNHIVDTRATKTTVGLGPLLNKTYEDIHATIASGNEDKLREEAASKLNAYNAAARNSQVQNALNSKPAPTPEELQRLMTPHDPVDPTSVTERSYGHNLVYNTLEQARRNMGDTMLDEAHKEAPVTTEASMHQGSMVVAKQEYINTWAEKIENTVSNQSTLGYLGDKLKSFGTLGLYDEVKLRGWMEGVPAIQGLGLGNNLYDQTRALLDLSFPEFKAKVDAILNQLMNDNPSLAAEYVQAINGMSSSETFTSNLSTGLTVGSLPGLGLAGKALTRGVELVSGVRSAVRDVVSAPRVTPADSLKGAGDLQGAAIEQVNKDIVDDINGTADPIAQAQQDPVSALKTGADQITPGTAPGLGQDLVNRIKESYNTAATSLWETISRVAKVNRIPEVLASKQAIKEIIESIKSDYKGPNNSVGDVVGPFYNSAANTHYFAAQLTREDGTLFTSVSEANNWAKLNGIVTKAPDGYLKELQARISELDAEIKAGPGMDADTAGLNRHFDLEGQVKDLKAEQERLIASNGEGFAVKKKGLGFYVERTIPLNETTPLVRSYLATTEASKTPFNWVNGVLGFFRTGNETFSKIESIQRQIATVGPSVLLGEAKKGIQDVNLVPKKYWEDWARVIDFSRTMPDPDTGLKGAFYRNINELEAHYLQYVKDDKGLPRMPTPAEVESYFAFKRNVEVDRVYRTLRLYSLKSRVGAEQHAVSYVGKDGKLISSNFFEGIIHKELPSSEDGIATITSDGKTKYNYANQIAPTVRKQLKEDIKQGRKKVIEVYDPARRPLSGFGKGLDGMRVRYVVADNLDTKPLSYENQVVRRGGGHFDYDYDYYIKQAKIRPERVGKSFRNWYEGDTTLMPISLRKLGQDVVEHLNNTRELIRDGKMDEAEAYHRTNLPMPWHEHRGWYEPSVAPDGTKVPPRLSKTEPFYVVPKDKTIIDMDKSLEDRFKDPTSNKTTFKDGTRQGSLSRQNAVRYTGERDAYDMFTINDLGTHNNPLYAYEPAKLVDPIPTMNRSLNSIIQSSFMDDSKIASVEHWIKEARPWLRASDSELAHSPFYHFANLSPSDWKPGTPPEIRRLLETNRMKMQQFTGMPSKVDSFLHSMASSLADSIYGKFGPKALLVSPTWLLPKLRDPLGFVRSVVYNAKLGLFNVPSFFVQAMTHTNIMGMAGPINASKGMFGTLMHQYSRYNSSPEILAHLSQLTEKMGWRPGEWLEAREALINSGFFNVDKEHAFADSVFNNDILKSKVGNFLDWGRVFFREGAQNTRGSAWYTAFKEYRDLHPTGALTRDDLDNILSRASDFDHNMSRASSSVLHTGIMSIPGQFYAYHLRLLELMTGSRLTAFEKARLFGINALMYGLPVSASLLDAPVIPVPWSSENIKETAKNHGYNVGDNFFTSTVMQGIPAALMAMVTGGLDPHKGNWYNVGDRWGPGNFDNINDSLDGDKSIWNMVGGAAGSTLYNFFTGTSNFRKAMGSLISGDQAAFPLKTEDFASLFKEISSFSNIEKLIMALHTGRWISKNGADLGPTSGLNAAFMATIGLQEQDAADANVLENMIKNQRSVEQKGLKNFIQQYQLGIKSMQDNDPDQAKSYFTRAYTWLESTGYPLDKRGSAVSTASNIQDLVSHLKWEYFFKDVPPAEREQRLQTYRRQLQLQSERNS